MRHLAGLLVGGLWIAVLVVWVALAPATKRTVERRRVPVRLLVLLLVAVVVTARAGAQGHAVLWHAGPVFSLVALAVVAAGMAFAVWARLTLGRNWSGAVVRKEDHELVERGPYALVRHPIYTGLLAMLLGTLLLTGLVADLVVFVGVVVGLAFKAREEERLMLATFPSEYPAYRRRVKAIIPFVL